MAVTGPLEQKFTLLDLKRARSNGPPVAMLTCYDYTTATHMRAAGVPSILVGDSAASVILGHDSTLPVKLRFLIELTQAVRRGHPECFLLGDMPFGSYQASTAEGTRNVLRMAQETGCDAVKLEVAESHLDVIRRATDAGVATVAHLGLRPQAVGVLGGYRTQGKSTAEADEIIDLATKCEDAGAVAVLLEAVPSETAARVVEATTVPVIGCGAGPHVHGHVVVTQDLLGLTARRPRFVPDTSDLATPMREAFKEWVKAVSGRKYPEPKHEYGRTPARSAT